MSVQDRHSRSVGLFLPVTPPTLSRWVLGNFVNSGKRCHVGKCNQGCLENPPRVYMASGGDLYALVHSFLSLSAERVGFGSEFHLSWYVAYPFQVTEDTG